MTTPTLEQEIEAQSTGVPVSDAPVAPAQQNNDNGDDTGNDASGNPTEISPRRAGQIRRQQEDEARQTGQIAKGVALALRELGLNAPAPVFAQAAAPPAAPALPDYLDGLDSDTRTQWAESIKITGQVARNAEERAVARAVQALEAKYGPQFATLNDKFDRSTASLRNGVASSFSASNQSVQKAQSMDGWEEFLNSEDESGMPRSSAHQFWMTSDPAKAAKILDGYSRKFLEANKASVPVGFAHMATPTTVAAAPVPGSGVKTVSAASINKLIADEMQKPNPDRDRLAGFREIFDKHAAAKTLVA